MYTYCIHLYTYIIIIIIIYYVYIYVCVWFQMFPRDIPKFPMYAQ